MFIENFTQHNGVQSMGLVFMYESSAFKKKEIMLKNKYLLGKMYAFFHLLAINLLMHTPSNIYIYIYIYIYILHTYIYINIYIVTWNSTLTSRDRHLGHCPRKKAVT